VIALKFFDEGRQLVSLGYEQTIKLWDTASWQLTRTIPLETSGARSISLSPDQGTMALIMKGKVQFWATGDWTVQQELPIGTPAVNSVAFSNDGHWLAVGAADKKIRVWSLT
jgi:WD40 repeat protein